MPTSADRPWRAALAGGAVAALITLPGLGAGTLWDNSETAYGEVAREILLTHDWVTMHFNAMPYFIQPPLYFWIGALFCMLFGVSAFALRLPSALATIALGAMTGYAVSRQAGTRVGIYASVVLSSCLMQAVLGRLAIMDALLDLCIAMTIFWWFRALQTGRTPYFVYGALAAGLGFLAKGPVAPVVALMVAVPYYFWNRRHEVTHAPSARGWMFAVLAFVVVALPWPLAVAISDPRLHPLRELIGQYTIGRYTGVIENQAGPVWYYIPVLLLGFFPWFAFLPMAIADGVRQLRGTQADPRIARLLRLAFTWIVIPLAFFSFARTKLPNYIALEFPALALLTAIYFDAVVRKGVTRSAVVSASFVSVTIVAVGAAIAIFIRTNRLGIPSDDIVPGLALMGLLVLIGSLLTALLLGRRSTEGIAPYALAASAALAIDTLGIVLLPHAEAYKPVPRLAAIIERDRQPGDVVAIQDTSGGNALMFYARPPVDVLASPPGDPEDLKTDPRTAICSAARIWLIAPRKRPAFDPTYGRRRTLVATEYHAALFLYDGPPCRDV